MKNRNGKRPVYLHKLDSRPNETFGVPVWLWNGKRPVYLHKLASRPNETFGVPVWLWNGKRPVYLHKLASRPNETFGVPAGLVNETFSVPVGVVNRRLVLWFSLSVAKTQFSIRFIGKQWRKEPNEI